MKKLLILFGILDIVTLVRSFGHVRNLWGEWNVVPWIVAGNLLTYTLLIFSAYFLIKLRKPGLWLTYVQFPLRLSFMVLSFAFLMTIAELFESNQVIYRIFLWGIWGLEILRLIVTIQIHRKYFGSK